MTSFEIKSTLGIAFIYILRMLGLFIVLPIMSLHLTDLSEYSSTFMIGLAFGMYGLTQALFQIPFGILSDKFGRKKNDPSGLVHLFSGINFYLLFTIFTNDYYRKGSSRCWCDISCVACSSG
jgi:MFS family permease